MQVTLAQLRKHKACAYGYNKLVAHLQGVPYTPSKTYKRWKHDAPISLETILDSNGVRDAIWAARCLDGYDRELRRFAVACARLFGPTDPRSIKALEVAEAYADGKATKKLLEKACSGAYAAYAEADTDRTYCSAAYAAARTSYAAADAAYNAANYALDIYAEDVTDLFLAMIRESSNEIMP